MKQEIQIKVSETTEDFRAAKDLILQYADWLGFDLSFQNFDQELDTLAETYGDPDGRLFLGYHKANAVGVAGIKRFSERECELKRMFVQPESRGLKIGQLLLDECIDAAKELNYEAIKLDTASFMHAAIKLYTENGFKQISAYRHNPHEHAMYFELDLSESSIL